jgi:hypothetical protein
MQNKEIFEASLAGAYGKNEPPLPSIISKSFVFVSSTGLRETSEIILLELFRETFFDTFSLTKSSSQLDPEKKGQYSEEEKAILYLTRGRQKKTRIKNFSGYFAPAYPSLARGGWLRKETDRQLRDAIFRGFLAQSLRDTSGKLISEVSKSIIDALGGHRSSNSVGLVKSEILSAAISTAVFDEKEFGLLNNDQAISRLIDTLTQATSGDKEHSYTFKSSSIDTFAKTLTEDLLAICDLERVIPRLQWLDILKCFLRLAICSWVLAKMRITVWIRDEILKIVENESYVSSSASFEIFLNERNLNLFKPSSSATDGPNVHIDIYIKARVELTVLCLALNATGGVSDWDKLELVATDVGSGKISMENFLSAFVSHRKQIVDLAKPLNLRQWLLRTCEKFPAWTSPRKKGQGKNLNEFLRVLARSGEGDGDNGYLVTPIKRGNRAMNYSIFPGPMLVKTISFLAAQKKRKIELKTGKGSDRLVLSDVENHFRQYGVEFGMTAGARPKLIAELQSLGLLVGSPDAGDSVSVKNPF